MGAHHPECPARLDAIEDRLLITGVADVLDRREAPLAAISELELAHDRFYIASLRGMTDQLLDDIKAGGPELVHIDGDTALNAFTWQAALRSAGAAIAATDAVMAGEVENAFCAVRPPGHHAERQQAMGFCFFNNVAVAVKHALARYPLKRVLVVDFDVHHGNGTEDILSGDPRVLMVGFFQHPFYPYSGAATPEHQPADNMLNVPVPAYTKGMALRELVDDIWMPRIDAFKPEMVFVSAGFDGHREDDMGQLNMNDQDFAWITSRIKDAALRHAQGRIVSCLEGGYALDALARSVEAHVRVLADV